MKKLFVTILALATAATAFAQLPKGLSVGVGYAAKSNRVITLQEKDFDTSLGGLTFGANYNISIGGSGLGIAPGIWFGFESGDFFSAAADF